MKSESSQQWLGTGLEVSVVLLEDEAMAAAGPTVSMPSITADVLAFLAESDEREASFLCCSGMFLRFGLGLLGAGSSWDTRDGAVVLGRGWDGGGWESREKNWRGGN